MKKATCLDLRGACSFEIKGATPEEMGENCKQHVMAMVQAGDEDHKTAITAMMRLSKSDQEKWHESFKKSFDSLESV